MRLSESVPMAAHLPRAAAAGPHPVTGLGRPGVEPDRHRPHVAVTHLGYEPAAARSTHGAGIAALPAGATGTAPVLGRHPADGEGRP